MKTRLLLFPLLLAFVVTACDSSDDGASDRDLLVGTHLAVKIEDDSGDRTAEFKQFVDRFTIALRDDDTFTMSVDFSAAAEDLGQTDQTLTGSFTVVEATNTLTLRVTVGGATVPATFTYALLSDDQARFSTNPILFETIFNTEYDGQLRITVERQ